MNTMKKTVHALWAVFFVALLHSSCKPEVDLYADYKEIPVIYGLIDYTADTNFVRITRSIYVGNDNPSMVVQNPDSIFFPEKLDVRLVEYKNGEKTRELLLDTIHRMYYTAEKLCKNTKDDKYRYELRVVINGKEIVSRADLVGGTDFRLYTPHLNFSKLYFGMYRNFKFGPAENAAFYDIDVKFHFKERKMNTPDTIDRVFTVFGGRYYTERLVYSYEEGKYNILYKPEYLYTSMGKYLGADTLDKEVYRYITDYPLEVVIDAAGVDFMNYLTYYDPNVTNAQGIPPLNCVGEGAEGLFSSRARIRIRGRLAGNTLPDLLKNGWNFYYIGGNTTIDALECENY